MNYDSNNIFARILRGEFPCHKVYEDEHTLSFMDIMPQTKGHTLVLPKEAAVTLLALSPQALQTTIITVQRIAAAVQRAVNAPAFIVSQFNGAAAGQTVPHVHFHILPSFPGQELHFHARDQADPTILSELAKRISAELTV